MKSQSHAQTVKMQLDRGLPMALEAERLVLGSIQLNGARFPDVAALLEEADFATERHRIIFRNMVALHEAGQEIDRITIIQRAMDQGQLEAVGGMSYLTDLDTGLPNIINLEAYVRTVRDKSLLRKTIHACTSLANRCLIGEEDPEEIIASGEEALLAIGGKQQGGLLAARQVVEEYKGGINSFLDPSKRPHGIYTSYRKLDEMTAGLSAGDLFILAARPSMGKTALALNIAYHVAAGLRLPTAIFSLEMSRESLLTRMLCAAARVDSQRFRLGYLDASERRRLQAGLQELVESPIYVDDAPGIHLMEVKAKLRRMPVPPALVIVDYLQLMSSRGKVENRNQEVSAMSRGLKLMAKELGIPFLVLSQLNRAPETRQGDHRPQLSDLKESGGIEQDADLVAFIFREEVYKKDREDLRGIAELILAKQRNGPVGTIPLVFLHGLTKFENRAEDLGPEDA